MAAATARFRPRSRLNLLPINTSLPTVTTWAVLVEISKCRLVAPISDHLLCSRILTDRSHHTPELC